jgi:hypothetical protein
VVWKKSRSFAKAHLLVAINRSPDECMESSLCDLHVKAELGFMTESYKHFCALCSKMDFRIGSVMGSRLLAKR